MWPGVATSVTLTIAERDLLTVGGDDVALRLAVRELIDERSIRLPIGRAHDEARLEAVLDQFGAADVIAVAVR